MTFANPDILFFLALAPLLILMFVLAEKKRRRQVNAMSLQEKPGMVMGAGFERRLAFLVLLCLGVILMIGAAARPQWGARMEDVTARGIDVLIAVDVSESMRAEDVSPSRIDKARQQVNKFLELLGGDRVSLIGFAGSAYPFVPFTVDYGAFKLFLNSLEPGSIEDAGTDVAKAIDLAIEVFDRTGSNAARVLVIFSDGETHEEDPIPAAKRAADANIQIFTVGVGNASKAGDRIPVGEENGKTLYKVDQQGNLVITRLDEETLTSVAQMAGGDYYRVSEAGTELVQIYKRLERQQEEEFASRAFRLKEDRFQIPLLVAVLLLAVAYSLGTRSFKKMRRTQGVNS
ncbi:MAG: VWA domain-containing protein [Acidobacteriota bacterium]|nr:VWA domain-containing protein [Acidobacteriota bacterium]